MPKPHGPIAKATLLIRRPVVNVFEAFVKPELLTRFWLAKASGPLQVGQTVRWEFMVPGAVVDTKVEALERNRRIEINWSDGTRVRWSFEDRGDGTTTVGIENSGFSGSPEQAIATAIEATQGFTLVLCDLKTLLESGTSHHITRDKALLISEKVARNN